LRIIKAYVEVDKFDSQAILQTLEQKGRVAYKSEAKITEDSAEKFVGALVKREHLSVLEHISIGTKFVVDRGISHELVRHRIGVAYTQESTRFCRYDNEITVIEPYELMKNSTDRYLWMYACKAAASAYFDLIDHNVSPQWARSVLPHSLKTEIEVTANLREWRHIFNLRAQSDAHPQIQQVMIPLLIYFQKLLPMVFSDIKFNKKFDKEEDRLNGFKIWSPDLRYVLVSY
jgi:thymidylate synthase (FAD)